MYRKSVNPDATPVRCKPYRINPRIRDAVSEQLVEMEACGIIEKGTSEWSSPIVPVIKADNIVRLTLDLRKLNSHVLADAYPLLAIDDLRATVSDAYKGIFEAELYESIFSAVRVSPDFVLCLEVRQSDVLGSV